MYEGRFPLLVEAFGGELAYEEYIAIDVFHRDVRDLLFVVEDAQVHDLAAEPFDVFRGIGVFDTDQYRKQSPRRSMIG